MLDARRYRAAAAHLGELLAREDGVRFREAPLPAHLRRTIVAADATARRTRTCSARRSGGCCGCRRRSACATSRVPRVTVAERLAHLRGLLRRGRFSFDEAVRGADRMTVAVTLFALLELYKRGEADWEQEESFGEIAVARTLRAEPPLARASDRRMSAGAETALGERWRRSSSPAQRRGRQRRRSRARSRRCCSSSADPLSAGRAGRRDRGRRGRGAGRARRCSPSSTRPGRRGITLRELGGGWTLASDPARRGRRAAPVQPPARSPRSRPAQAETLAIVAYLQPISRPEITRIRGVSADSATATLLERGLIEEAGHSQFGAVLYRTSTQFLKLFGLRTLEELPDVARWDPTPEEQAELRERLLRAGEARAGGGARRS